MNRDNYIKSEIKQYGIFPGMIEWAVIYDKVSAAIEGPTTLGEDGIEECSTCGQEITGIRSE